MICSLRVCVLFLTTLTVALTEDNVTFYLFTQETPDNYIKLDANNPSQYIKNDTEIFFIIHGWSEDRTAKWMQDLKNALLERPDKNYNVIQVDYDEIASEPYPIAVRESPTIGSKVGDFIINLTTQGIPLDHIHVCGHSLGGHVAGYAGAYIFNKTSRKLPRITALDPAGPLFQGFGKINGKCLSKDDAKVVYVIHTDATKFGYDQADGTVDVFPNGGAALQPGCPDFARGDIFFCSHHKSYHYYIYAVAHPKFLLAVKCGSYEDFKDGECDGNRMIDIGGEVSAEDEGKYYLRTKARRPYKLVP